MKSKQLLKGLSKRRKELLVGFGIRENTLAGSLEEKGSDLKMCG